MIRRYRRDCEFPHYSKRYPVAYLTSTLSRLSFHAALLSHDYNQPPSYLSISPDLKYHPSLFPLHLHPNDASYLILLSERFTYKLTLAAATHK